MAKDLDLLQSEEGLFFGTFNDIIIKNHDMKLIDGAEKIAQDIVKILLITKGSHLLFPNYGTLIATYINGRKISSIDENIIIYVFDFNSMPEDFDNFVQGKYSLYSPEAKKRLMDYYFQ